MNEQLIDDDFLEKETQVYRFRPWLNLCLLLFFLMGLVFRVFYWPGASFLILTSSAILMGYSLSGLLALKGRHVLNLVIVILSLCWFIWMVYGIIIRGGSYYGIRGLLYYLILILMTLFIRESAKRNYTKS